MSNHLSKPGAVGVREFGSDLIVTRDLDPLYCGLVGVNFSENQLKRWLLAYWMFYHVGVSSFLSSMQGQAFWDAALIAARNEDKKWPRAAERRHFRGPRCVAAVEELSKVKPEFYVSALLECDNVRQAMEEVQQWPLFGPWIAFKVVDMLERCMGWPHHISPDAILLYDTPSKALTQLANQEQELKTRQEVFSELVNYFSVFRAPPRFDRMCGPAEVETALCKWKSSWSGHYWVGKDIHEHRAACEGWGPAALALQEAYPPEVVRLRPNPSLDRRPLQGMLF